MAPDTGRDGMVDLTEALAAVDIVCVESFPAPDRFRSSSLLGIFV